MTAEPRASWTVEPFREGTAEDYARFRELLTAAAFTESSICEQYGVGRTAEFRTIREGRSANEALDTTRALLIRLFLDGEPVEWQIVESVLSAEERATIDRLGLLDSPQSHPEWCRATVMLYPTQGLWIASDVNSDYEGAQMLPPVDVVYPAITIGTQRFVDLMPRQRCERFVELCSGTAIAALVAAREFATHAWAVDITERATRFARFNAGLNGITNFTALEGDLWVPLGEETVDCVVAHPPYMPSFETQYVFRDGGEDGEQVTRRILSGLAAHLRPGGNFFCHCLASDRRDAPLEQRIRTMLGDASPEFDLVLAQKQTYDPVMYYASQAKDGRAEWSGVERRQEAFERLGITQLILGSMLVRRRVKSEQAMPSITERRRMHESTVAGDFSWLLDHRGRLAANAVAETPEEFRPRAVQHLEVRIAHHLGDTGWVAPICELVTSRPFSAQVQCPPWVSALVMRCDGEANARTLLESLKQDGLVPDEAGEREFSMMLLRLVSVGVLEVREWPHPPVGGATGW